METERLVLNGRTFKKLYSRVEVDEAMTKVATEIAKVLDGKNALLMAIANGGSYPLVDLTREFYDQGVMLDADTDATRLHSYEGVGSTGDVKQLYPSKISPRGRIVLVVEDIVDSGRTMNSIVKQLYAAGAAKVYTFALFDKRDARLVEAQLDFYGLLVPNAFLVGGGLDYDGKGRGLPDIWIEEKSA